MAAPSRANAHTQECPALNYGTIAALRYGRLQSAGSRGEQRSPANSGGCEAIGAPDCDTPTGGGAWPDANAVSAVARKVGRAGRVGT